MLRLITITLILLAGSFWLPAQQDYTYVVDEDFTHYENIYKAVEGLLWTENDQIIISAQFHISSGHFGMVRLFSNGMYDDSFGYSNSNGGGGGECLVGAYWLRWV